MMSMKCRTCNTTFQDNGSLEIHYQYTHSNGCKEANSSSQDSSSSREQPPDAADSTETNNNRFFKFRGESPATLESGPSAAMTAISPGIVHSSANDSNHSTRNENQNFSAAMAARDLLVGSPYNLNHNHMSAVSHPYEPGYILGSGADFPRSSPHPAVSGVMSNQSAYSEDQRYHPYYKSGFRDLRNQLPIGSPHHPQPHHHHHLPIACDKCDFVCASQEVLLHHINVSHGIMHAAFNPRFTAGNNRTGELQAEILDLDSHKVHVYQPPNGQDNRLPDAHQQQQQQQQRSVLESWIHDADKKFYPMHHLPQQNGSANGNGGTPLASPDFGNVSTTTDNIESLHSALHSPFRGGGAGNQFDQQSGMVTGSGPTPNQITSSDGPPIGKSSGKSSSKSGNGSWKSNEPRRPKTYNCSACNKWFTSSGHLKRHYNTTLHKNAVKQSGIPDPATLPISVHHHPHKDPTFVPSGRQMKNSPPTSTESTSSSEPSTSSPAVKINDRPVFSNRTTPNQQQQQQQQHHQPQMSPVNSFLHASPNLMAGPSEIPGGLQHPHPSYTSQCSTPELLKSPSPISSVPPPPPASLLHSNHLNYLPFTTTVHQPAPPPPTIPLFQQPTQSTFYPNFQSPHVSTIRQVTPSINHTGEDDGDNHLTEDSAQDANSKLQDSLPSFSCIQRNACATAANNLWNYSQYFGLDQLLGTLHNGNVGGHFSRESGMMTSAASTNAVDENTPPPAAIKREPVDELVDEDAYSQLFSTKKFNDCRRNDKAQLITEPSFDPVVPDTKVEISPKREDSLYDDENTTVSSSTVDSNLQTPSPSEPIKGQFLCEKCHKAFNKACYLTQHNKSFHSGYKPFKCARCGKRFTEAKQYKDHTDKHAGDKPHKCEICPKQFNHKTDLRRHVCLHTNVRPHICDLCQKGFIRKDHMLKHRETHANRKQVLRHVKIQKIKKELELEILC